jgi:hypothetical protein
MRVYPRGRAIMLPRHGTIQHMMGTKLTTFALVLLLCSAAEAADLSGTWALEFEQDKNSPLYQADCSFKQEGAQLSGSCLSGFESIVTVRGNVQPPAVTFQFRTGTDSGTQTTFSGRLDDQETSIKGTFRFVDAKGNTGQGTFTATRK